MHEMALTKDIVDTVIEYAGKANATKVKAVFLNVGFARDVVDELFQSCFDFYARNTIAQGASIIINRIPVTMRCKECGTVFPINLADSDTWKCPVCSSHDYKSNTGMEFRIEGIQVE
jgi:hydrogenase nickel incorporation protein HypA/HybF